MVPCLCLLYKEAKMLRLNNISYQISKEKYILKKISLEIEDGQLLAVTGPNGSGKSTLAKIIAGIYPASFGEIILNGENITGLDVTGRARKGISSGFQRPVCFKGLTVRTLLNIAAGKELAASELKSLLSMVGLCMCDYSDRELNSSLSGGELKRIEIASVLARRTQVNIFDEPEAGIDLWSFQKLIDIFQSMKSNSAESQVIISHQKSILEIADRIAVINEGVVVKYGEPAEILPELFGEGAKCKCPIGKACEK